MAATRVQEPVSVRRRRSLPTGAWRTAGRGATAAVAAVLVLHGCSMFRKESAESIVASLQEQVRVEIRTVVPDEARQTAMLETLDSLNGLMAESEALLRSLRARERTLFRDYDATRDAYLTLFTTTREERRTLQKEILEAHLRLKELAEPEEWERISIAESRAVLARVDSMNKLVLSQ
jgi:anti-sigma-K factor RskA